MEVNWQRGRRRTSRVASHAEPRATVSVLNNEPAGRERPVKRVAVVIGVVLGLYLIVRAIAEPFVIDMSDPATYGDDWGGPSLAGVLAVHMSPGVVSAAVLIGLLVRRRSSSRST